LTSHGLGSTSDASEQFP